MGAEPIDVVYTWVDDRWPGYLAERDAHAGSDHDRNPNRTRDNLDILRYSLRSLERYMPWVRHVYLVSMRPQVPPWLDRACPGLTVVHHDEFLDSTPLPTFNSFAIVAGLAAIPGLAGRFVYLCDDMLLGRPVAPSDFLSEDGRPLFYRRPWRTRPPADRHRQDISPWNAALAEANRLLDERFGEARWCDVDHVPLLVERSGWEAMLATWPEAFERTRNARFRARYNVPAEHLYPHFMCRTGRGVYASYARTYRASFYAPLENSLALAWASTALLRLLPFRFVTMNDNFGDRPNPRSVAVYRRFLQARYPRRSRFEASA